jgi:hypothetical protein
MAQRKIAEFTGTDAAGKTLTAKVYRDSEWQEYIVQHYVNGKLHQLASYHTLGISAECKVEALQHAERYATGL